MKQPLHLFFFITISLLIRTDAMAQDPDLAADEDARLEEIFRSSDYEGQTPTNRRRRDDKTKRVSVPKNAFRIGCVCMDDSRADTHSIGSCSGHGGVRYWIYRTPEGDTVHILTGRHERHPHALNASELSELSQKRSDRLERLPKAGQSLAPAQYSQTQPPFVIMPAPAEPQGRFGWGEVAAVGLAGIALFFTVRLILFWAGSNPHIVRYALRHLLRHRKRPAARQKREDTDEERLP